MTEASILFVICGMGLMGAVVFVLFCLDLFS